MWFYLSDSLKLNKIKLNLTLWFSKTDAGSTIILDQYHFQIKHHFDITCEYVT